MSNYKLIDQKINLGYRANIRYMFTVFQNLSKLLKELIYIFRTRFLVIMGTANTIAVFVAK